MNTTPEALKNLYVALGGEAEAVANLSKSVDVLNAIAEKFGGVATAITNPDAIDNITAVASDIGGGGSPKEGEDYFIAGDVLTSSATNSNSIEFEGVKGQPSYYFMYVNGTFTTTSTQRVVSAWYGGAKTAVTSSSKGSIASDQLTTEYSDGKLTVTAKKSQFNGAYDLYYFYMP